MTAPPTPVETVMKTKFAVPRALPQRCSPSAAAFVSRSTRTSRQAARESASPSSSPARTGPVFGGVKSLPVRGSTGPVTLTPILSRV